MRVTLVPLLLVPLVGCSNLLGIQDPSAGSDSGTGSGSDGGVDAPPRMGMYLMPSFPVANLLLGQRARIHVLLMHNADLVKDVSTTPGLIQSTAPTTAVAGLATDGLIPIDGLSSGTATLTAHYDGADDAILPITVSTTACHVVINEVVTGTKAHGLTDEFVELYNPCLTSFNTDVWTLDYRSMKSIGTGADDQMLVQLSGTMDAGVVRLYAGAGFVGTATTTDTMSSGISEDASIALRMGAKSVGPIIDSVAYGDVMASNPFIEAMPTAELTEGLVAVRAGFDGNDSDNNKTDFSTTATATPTPGALNFP